MFLLPLNLRVFQKYLDSNLNMTNKLSLHFSSHNVNKGNLPNVLTDICHRLYCSKPAAETCSHIQHKYTKALEKLMNIQIKEEFIAAYTYLNMANYFARSDIALPGVYGFFMKMFYEEIEHGLGFIKYQTLRGGTVLLSPLTAAEPCTWDLPAVFYCGLDMEKAIKEKLQNIHNQAGKDDDTDVQNFIDDHIKHQEKSIQEMARYYTRTKLLTNKPIGQYLFDREIHKTHVAKDPPKFNIETANKLYA